jgi:ATP/ADP translocase
MEFTEIIWKATVKLYYPSKQDYMEFMGNYSTVVRLRVLIWLRLPRWTGGLRADVSFGCGGRSGS